MMRFIDNFAPVSKYSNPENARLAKLLHCIKDNSHNAHAALKDYNASKLRNKDLRKFAIDHLDIVNTLSNALVYHRKHEGIVRTILRMICFVSVVDHTIPHLIENGIIHQVETAMTDAHSDNHTCNFGLLLIARILKSKNKSIRLSVATTSTINLVLTTLDTHKRSPDIVLSACLLLRLLSFNTTRLYKNRTVITLLLKCSSTWANFVFIDRNFIIHQTHVLKTIDNIITLIE
jgi:hypothetical protein